MINTFRLCSHLRLLRRRLRLVCCRCGGNTLNLFTSHKQSAQRSAKKKMKERAKNVLKRKLKHHLRQPRTLDVALVLALRCAAAFIITPVSFLAVAPLLLLLMLLPCLCSHCWLAALLIYCILFSRCIFSAFSALVLRFCFVASCHSISLALESRAGEMMY